MNPNLFSVIPNSGKKRPLRLMTTTLFQRLRLRLLKARSAIQPADRPEALNARPGSRSFLRRVTATTLAQIPAHLASLSPPRLFLDRRARARRELRAFAGDPDRLLASVALTCRPSTLKTKAAVLAATFPEHRERIAPHIAWAQMKMATRAGRPVSAKTFVPSAFSLACRIFPDATVARACRILWATASRAADLAHFVCEQVVSTAGVLWKITFQVVEHNGRLKAAKGTQHAKRTIVKWLPARADFDPRGLTHITWSHVDCLTKTIGCTPHSIRQSASRYLEDRGFSQVERAALTGHAISGVTAPGIRAYSSNSWADAQSLMAMRQARLLMEALSS